MNDRVSELYTPWQPVIERDYPHGPAEVEYLQAEQRRWLNERKIDYFECIPFRSGRPGKQFTSYAQLWFTNEKDFLLFAIAWSTCKPDEI